VLVVGCGCRGRALATALRERGHQVRGTTRSEEGLDAIRAVGADALVADPDRLGTLLPALAGTSAICWLMGTASGDTAAAVHGPRLRSLLERLVDTPVRGFVYEAAGPVAPEALAAGAAAVREAAATWRMPVAVVEADPAGRDGWLRAMTAAVAQVLA
jgi:uncharacterized protein YbjT (DUF2867 family)